MRKKRKKQNKYAPRIDAEIHLRGLRLQEAMAELFAFIEAHQGERVRIITGKGIGSPDGVPIIRSEVIDYLERQGIKWKYEKQNKGGEGALVIKL